MKNKATLPISMNKSDMIKMYEILYNNYASTKQAMNNQAMYIEILMNMLLKKGMTQQEINDYVIDRSKKYNE